jgi:hypothetical protein
MEDNQNKEESPEELDSEPSVVNKEQTAITKPETGNMEVHHHPQLAHRPKPWKEYLLEFLMIFLAVTMGFFAESLREHISEKGKAEVFAQSLYADYKADTLSLHQLIDYTFAKITHIDSLDYFIHTARTRNNDSSLYGCIFYMLATFQFDNINGTYEQIKNSGSLRFFNQTLVNSLNSYDATSLKLKLMEDWENKVLFEKVAVQAESMFNFKVFADFRNGGPVRHEMYLKEMDKNSIDLVLNQAELIKRLRERQLVQQKSLLQKADEILSGLKKEYDVKNE